MKIALCSVMFLTAVIAVPAVGQPTPLQRSAQAKAGGGLWADFNNVRWTGTSLEAGVTYRCTKALSGGTIQPTMYFTLPIDGKHQDVWVQAFGPSRGVNGEYIGGSRRSEQVRVEVPAELRGRPGLSYRFGAEQRPQHPWGLIVENAKKVAELK